MNWQNQLEILRHTDILYVEDHEPTIAEISEILGLFSDHVHVARDADEAYELYETFKPSLMIVDIKLSGNTDGLELLRKIRQTDRKTVAVILSAYSEKEMLLQATELYLCRYLIKPIEEEMLMSVLTECAKEVSQNMDKEICLGEGYRFDTLSETLIYHDKPLSLTKNETLLLELLLNHRNHNVSYDSIYSYIWYDEPVGDTALRTLIKELRKKLPDGLIQNIPRIGYRISF